MRLGQKVIEYFRFPVLPVAEETLRGEGSFWCTGVYVSQSAEPVA